MLCLLISQQPTTPYGIAASSANFCACCRTGIWFLLSWSLSEIATLPSPLVTAPKAGCDARRTASRRVQSWPPLLFNIYRYDLPTTISKKIAYADDLAILHSTGDWQTLEFYPEHENTILVPPRRPFVPAALDLLNNVDALSNSAAGNWADHKWNTEW